MKREIKYQLVWQGCIYEPLTLKELIEGAWDLKSEEYEEIGDIASIPAKDYRYFSEAENDYGVWREYTGLKDKNGVEIYEFDYVEYKENIYKVFFNKFKISLENISKKDTIDLTDEILSDLSIKGNIYENK